LPAKAAVAAELAKAAKAISSTLDDMEMADMRRESVLLSFSRPE
jgi:hypothetical protein